MLADEIAKRALSGEGLISTGSEMEVQKRPSIEEISTFAIQSTCSWMTPIISFLQDGRLPQDIEEAKYILEEIHEGVYGDHAGLKSLVSKVIRTGYF